MMDDKQLTEEYLDGKVVFPGKIIRVEHWHVRLPNGETALREVACMRMVRCGRTIRANRLR